MTLSWLLGIVPLVTGVVLIRSGRFARRSPPVGAENCVSSCDVHVFVDEAAEAVSS